MKVSEYIASVGHAAHTIVEGMAVTFSHLLREPITVQYPDKTARPVSQTLPQRYRGLLEVQIDICSGCRRCERTCPIEVISIELTKDPATKKLAMSRFDIDVGKCMFCGLCVEVCAEESLGGLRHTREFEGACQSPDALVFRFVPDGQLQPLYKPPKDRSEVRFTETGVHAREARERAKKENLALFSALREGRPLPKPAAAVPPKPATAVEAKAAPAVEAKAAPAVEAKAAPAVEAKAAPAAAVEASAPKGVSPAAPAERAGVPAAVAEAKAAAEAVAEVKAVPATAGEANPTVAVDVKPV